MQILRLHWRKLLDPRSGLSFAQRFGYLNAALQWLNDPLALGYTLMLLVGAASVSTGSSLLSLPVTEGLVLISPLFLLISMTRFLWAFRLSSKCTWTEAIDALTVLLGLTWVVAQACLRGLVCREGVFLRTPKQGDGSSMVNSLMVVRAEAMLGFLCTCGAIVLGIHPHAQVPWTGGLSIALLVWQAMVYLAAVRAGVWSYKQSREGAPAIAVTTRKASRRSPILPEPLDASDAVLAE